MCGGRGARPAGAESGEGGSGWEAFRQLRPLPSLFFRPRPHRRGASRPFCLPYAERLSAPPMLCVCVRVFVFVFVCVCVCECRFFLPRKT